MANVTYAVQGGGLLDGWPDQMDQPIRNRQMAVARVPDRLARAAHHIQARRRWPIPVLSGPWVLEHGDDETRNFSLKIPQFCDRGTFVILYSTTNDNERPLITIDGYGGDSGEVEGAPTRGAGPNGYAVARISDIELGDGDETLIEVEGSIRVRAQQVDSLETAGDVIIWSVVCMPQAGASVRGDHA